MTTFSTVCIILIMAGTSFPDPSDGTPTTCSRGSDLEQTISTFSPCGKQIDRHGDLVQTIPMVIPMSSYMHTRCGRRNMFGKQWGHTICRFKAPTSSTPPTTQTPRNVTTETPPTTVTTQTPTPTIKNPTPKTVATHTPTTSITNQTPKNVTTPSPSTSVTTQTPTTSVTTQTPSTTVITPTPTMGSVFTPSPTPMNCTPPAENCKVFVTNNGEGSIFWADMHGPDKLQFSVFLDLEGKKPSDVNFDPLEQKVYWSDIDNKQIWRVSLEGQGQEAVTHENSCKPMGIVIAVQARYLYCTYENGWINRVMLGNPDSEERFVEGVDKPRALAIDEQQGYLYWSRDEGIDRKRLNGMEGTDEVLSMPSFSKIVGLMINSAGTRLFFCDENSKEALYFDIGSSNPVELIGSDRGYVLRDVSMDGNGVLYWLESGEKRILVMGDYERSTDFHIEAENEFTNPQRIHIASINP